MKGQSAIEFLSMVSMSALILAALYGFAASKQQDLSELQRSESAEAVVDRTTFEIEMALVQGKGYSRAFYLPETIQGRYYNISTGKTNAIVKFQNSTRSFDTLYRGDWVNVSTRDSNTFRVYNNGSVHIRNAG